MLLDATDAARLAAIASDRARPLKHIQHVRIVLVSAERLSVQDVARRAGVGRPVVWRWQLRYAKVGVKGLLHDKTRPTGTPPHLKQGLSSTLAISTGRGTRWVTKRA